MSVKPLNFDAAATNEEELNEKNCARLSGFISQHSGIKMSEKKKAMLKGRVARRMRATGMNSLNDYCKFVFEGENLKHEGAHLINAITTNKTDFFRESGHFDYLRSVVLPELSERGVRKIRAWSAACSTGPEPYSIAMVLDDYASEQKGVTYGILATDLNTDVLATARKGIYPTAEVEHVPDSLRRKYVMTSCDPSRGESRIVPALRSAIGFAQGNLMCDRYLVGDLMHVIFCRNVLIYFDRETQYQVVKKLLHCLAPGGYLFLGHSESIAGFELPIKQVANTVFKRI